MAYVPADILEVFKRVKDEVNKAAAKPRSLSIKSCGTQNLGLGPLTSNATGYWDDPNLGTSKPPRWIVQVSQQSAGIWSAQAPSSTIGYFNVSDSTTSIVVLRALLTVQSSGMGSWAFPEDWECLLVLTFDEALKSPLASGGSSVTITDFDPGTRTVKSSGQTYRVVHVAVVRGPDPAGTFAGLAYDDAVAAVTAMTNATQYDGRSEADIIALANHLDAALSAVTSSSTGTAVGPFVIKPLTSLQGVEPIVYRQVEAAVNTGKRHVIFYGPPGTGKTTIAEYVAEELALWARGDSAYVMLTASSAWTAQDLVGGYQPMGGARGLR